MVISCNFQTFEVIIENKTNETINSLNLNIQSNNFNINKIEANKTSIIKIPYSAIKLNAHDIRIESTTSLKNGKINSGFYFSDLSGTPNAKYTVKVYNSYSIIK